MSSDPLSRLQESIAARARERDIRIEKIREEQAAKEQLRDQAREIWTRRKKELPGIVKIIDGMLKGHGYAGLAMGHLDLKHPDVDRAVVEFEHSLHNHSKILLCLTRSGDFTCAIGTVGRETGSAKLPIADLTEDRLKDVLAHAVEACLGGERTPGDAAPPVSSAP